LDWREGTSESWDGRDRTTNQQLAIKKKPFGATSRSNIAADYGPFLAGPILDITGELIADGSIASFF
jgi:hypothetical protein